MRLRTSANQDKQFISAVISSTLLEEAIEFIKDNFEAEDIYGKEHMEKWAKDNGCVEEEQFKNK